MVAIRLRDGVTLEARMLRAAANADAVGDARGRADIMPVQLARRLAMSLLRLSRRLPFWLLWPATGLRLLMRRPRRGAGSPAMMGGSRRRRAGCARRACRDLATSALTLAPSTCLVTGAAGCAPAHALIARAARTRLVDPVPLRSPRCPRVNGRILGPMYLPRMATGPVAVSAWRETVLLLLPQSLSCLGSALAPRMATCLAARHARPRST
jgi:hypothetical protein